MFSYMSLPIAFHSKLQSTLIAHKWFDAPEIIFVKDHFLTFQYNLLMRSHVLFKKSFSEICFVTKCTFEGSLPSVLVLPHMVVQVTFGHKLLLTDITLIWLLPLMFHPADR